MAVQDYFFTLCNKLDQMITAPEIWLTHLAAENTRFCRFNHGKMRQQGTIHQASLELTLANGQKHSSHTLTLSLDETQDTEQLGAAIKSLRSRLQSLPDDPFFLVNQTPENTTQVVHHDIPDATEISDTVTSLCQQDDFVGIVVAGNQYEGFANAFGQRNWFEARDFNLDYSLYLHSDKAAKDSLAGNQWQPDLFRQRLEQQRNYLSLLSKTPVELKPGKYRVYLTPTALNELVNMMSFSAQSVCNKSSPLRRLHNQEASLNAMINIALDTGSGQVPSFQSDGFVMPEKISLIEQGKSRNLLVSPRTALEYNLTHNGAPTSESASSLIFQGGHLAQADALKQLDNGIFISNLWYLNYSDTNTARITGMTRFACFLVEKGEIKAPVNALRFDDSLYHLLGDQLEALTSETEALLSTNTYWQRGRGVTVLPGALLNELTFTL